MEWYNQPPVWVEEENGQIKITSGAKTDFWRLTHYGFVRDNGHFYYQRVDGDFVAEVKFSGQYQDLYDQAGLMVRTDETNWIKCGIEYVDGVQQVSAVVTRDYSDWSIVPLPANPAWLYLRVTREGSTLQVHYSLDAKEYALLRMAYFAPDEAIKVGLMCASPDGEGFSVIFENFIIKSK